MKFTFFRIASFVLAFLLACVALPVPALAAGDCTVTLNGERITVPGGILELGREGSQLIYATVTDPAGETVLSTEERVNVTEGMTVEAHYLTMTPYGDPQARVCTPLGLRFVTLFSHTEWTALRNDPNVKKLNVGTLISPTSLVLAKGTLNREVMGEGEVLNVPASARRYYDENVHRDAIYIAGSISDIKPENYTRNFTGVAYVDITFKDGTVKTVYATSDPARMSTGSVAVASAYQLLSEELSIYQTRALKPFEAALKAEGGYDMIYKKDLQGLNVLAIGDSLFYGAKETVGDAVWVNRLGLEFGWNLTNLGIGGATVSYDPDRTAPNKSMYELLTTDENYKWGSAEYYSAGTPSGDPDDVDLILLEGGSNDYGTKVQAPMGKPGEKDPATFLGAWEAMTEILLDRYPNATVVFVTAWQNSNQQREDNANAIEFTSSILELYSKRFASHPRVACIDAGDPVVSGVNMRNGDFRAQYAYDAFHLNDAGMALMAESMRPLLWKRHAAVRLVARTEVEIMRRDLAKLNVLAIGDSLFYGSGKTMDEEVWMNILAGECAWNLTNLGLSGATISHTPNNAAVNKPSMYDRLMNDPGYCFGSRSDINYYTYGDPSGDKKDVDVILLQAGSNDYGTTIQAPLGEIGSTDPGTFLGAWHLVVDELLEQYPNATVVMMTAWENIDQTREDNANAIEYTSSVLGLYSALYAENDRVKLIDSGDPGVSGVDMRDRAFRNLFAYDSFHLNDDGMKIMAENMLPWLWAAVGKK